MVTAMDDSFQAAVKAYEGGRITLESAAQALADWSSQREAWRWSPA